MKTDILLLVLQNSISYGWLNIFDYDYLLFCLKMTRKVNEAHSHNIQLKL